MTKRKYNQVCALSAALDVVGERWTLMVIRELLFGPRRYSDILRGTPGLGTNLLAQRLKDLETADLIQQRKLPPPAASSVYELTENGRLSLLPIIRALTNMGVDYLQYPPEAGQFVPASSTMGALAKFFQRGQDKGYSIAVEFRTDDDVFHCAIEQGTMTELGFGERKTADLRLHATTDTYMGLIVGYIPTPDALANKALALYRGSEQQASTFFAQFAAAYTPL